MQKMRKPGFICAFVLAGVFSIVVADLHLAAQTAATATILGTVTDSSGGAVPEANVQVTNTGTGAMQTVTSDAQGRYRVRICLSANTVSKQRRLVLGPSSTRVSPSTPAPTSS